MSRLRAALESAEEQEATGKEVIFYAWIDAGNQSQPSSMTFRVSGGQRHRDTDGRIVATDYHEEKFNMGMLRTSDPKVIACVRKMIEKGETITEDKEVYLSFIEPAERRSKRLAMKASQLTTELEAKETRIRELEAKLKMKAGGKAEE